MNQKPVSKEVQERIDGARARKAARLVAWIDAFVPSLLGLDPKRDSERIAHALRAWDRDQWAKAAKHARCNAPGAESIALVIQTFETRNRVVPFPSRAQRRIGPKLGTAIDFETRAPLTTRAAIAMVPKPSTREDAEAAAVEVARLGEALKEIGR